MVDRIKLPERLEGDTDESYLERCVCDETIVKQYPEWDSRLNNVIYAYVGQEYMGLVDTLDFVLRANEYFAKGEFEYKDPKTGEIYTYERRGIYKKNGRTLVFVRKK